MKITRICSTPDGGSTLQDLETPTDNPSNLLLRFGSELIRVSRLEAGHFGDWHPTPQGRIGDVVLKGRQFAVVLSGILEIGTTDGKVRRWNPGEVMVSDNVEGRGHTTRVLEGPVHIMNIQLPASFDFKRGTD